MKRFIISLKFFMQNLNQADSLITFKNDTLKFGRPRKVTAKIIEQVLKDSEIKTVFQIVILVKNKFEMKLKDDSKFFQ